MSVTEWKSSVIWGIAVEIISRSYGMKLSARLRSWRRERCQVEALLLYFFVGAQGGHHVRVPRGTLITLISSCQTKR